MEQVTQLSSVCKLVWGPAEPAVRALKELSRVVGHNSLWKCQALVSPPQHFVKS